MLIWYFKKYLSSIKNVPNVYVKCKSVHDNVDMWWKNDKSHENQRNGRKKQKNYLKTKTPNKTVITHGETKKTKLKVGDTNARAQWFTIH